MIKLSDMNKEYGLILAVCFLMVAGIVMIHSASTGDNIEFSGVWQKQIIWAVLALAVMIGVMFIQLKVIYALS